MTVYKVQVSEFGAELHGKVREGLARVFVTTAFGRERVHYVRDLGDGPWLVCGPDVNFAHSYAVHPWRELEVEEVRS